MKYGVAASAAAAISSSGQPHRPQMSTYILPTPHIAAQPRSADAYADTGEYARRRSRPFDERSAIEAGQQRAFQRDVLARRR